VAIIGFEIVFSFRTKTLLLLASIYCDCVIGARLNNSSQQIGFFLLCVVFVEQKNLPRPISERFDLEANLISHAPIDSINQ
jgi:hypothetical protein